MNKSTKHILEELKKGICELIIVDEFSVEDVISATLCPMHLPDVEDDFDISSKKHTVHLWNVVKEKWQTYPVNYIIDIDRLTGLGAKTNEKKLQPCEERVIGFMNMEDMNGATKERDLGRLY
jgi:hypothetical protein